MHTVWCSLAKLKLWQVSLFEGVYSKCLEHSRIFPSQFWDQKGLTGRFNQISTNLTVCGTISWKKHAFHLFKYFVSLHFLRISSKKNTIWIITWHINRMTKKWYINCCQILRIYTIPRYNNIYNTCIHKPTLLWLSTVYKFPYRKEFCQNKLFCFISFLLLFTAFMLVFAKKKKIKITEVLFIKISIFIFLCNARDSKWGNWTYLNLFGYSFSQKDARNLK